jgi:serine/threonine protein kinase
VSITCPYCRNTIKLKSVKPGRFTPKCPKCAKAFVLTVPADPAQPPVVAAIKPAAAAAPAPAAAVEQTAPIVAEPSFEKTAALSAAAVEQTAALGPSVVSAPAPDATVAFTGASDAGSGSAHERTEVMDATSPGGAAPNPDATVALGQSGTGTSPGVGEATEPGGGSSAGGDLDGVPKSLGGYTIVKLLGKGGMGAVYMARQVSLDRDVALKVMNPQWAKDPAFLARFTREAYAAAQLVHHNIVQIYDIGEEHDTPFFSMEFVKGKNLGQVTHSQGKLDVDEAVGYILQAARGLKFAHDQGMVHRDIKPDNLMLNDQGIVKVADLGLVKTAGMAPAEDQAGGGGGSRPPSLTGLASLPSVTNVGVAMGTPSYMAPEQGRNAATVDHRADIYSLGCTLYVMVTGRPPFQGKSALEVMTKHLTEPVVAPDQVAKRVPKALSGIIVRMLAKKPEDRYPDLGAVIVELEKFLGVTTAGAFTPTEEHAATLESAVKQFNNAPAAQQRKIAVPAFFGALGLAVFLSLLLAPVSWKIGLSVGLLAIGAMTVVGTFLTSGIVYRTHLFLKAREMLLDSNWGERTRWALYLILGVGALALLMSPLILILSALVAAGICALYHILIERKLVEERAKALAKAEGLLKKLRLRGLEEDALRQFIAKYSGEHWEELYEALFGYDLMIQARQRLAASEGGKRRARHAAWRDPIVHWLETRQRQARELRERKHLQKIEQKKLEAEGISKAEASSRAAAAADVMVEGAADMKKAAAVVAGPAADGGSAEPPKPLFNAKKLMEAAAKAEKDHDKRKKAGGPGLLKMIYSVTIGPQPRFLLAVVLIFGFSLWAYQNKQLIEAVKSATQTGLEDGSIDKKVLSVETRILNVPFLPEAIRVALSSFNPAVAAVLLIFSALWRSPLISIFFFAAAVFMLVGPQMGIFGQVDAPFVGNLSPNTIALAGGLVLAVLGVAADRLLVSRAPASRAW